MTNQPMCWREAVKRMNQETKKMTVYLNVNAPDEARGVVYARATEFGTNVSEPFRDFDNGLWLVQMDMDHRPGAFGSDAGYTAFEHELTERFGFPVTLVDWSV